MLYRKAKQFLKESPNSLGEREMIKALKKLGIKQP